MKVRKLIPIILLFLISCKGAESIIYQDLSFLYNTDAPVLKKKVYYDKDSVNLIVSFTKTDRLKSLHDLYQAFTFSGRVSVEASKGDVINLDSLPITLLQTQDVSDRLILKYRIPLKPQETYFFLKIHDKSKDQERVLEFGQIFRKDSPEKLFLMFDEFGAPNTNEFFSVKNTFKFKNSVNLDSIHFASYAIDFPPAAHPANTLDRGALVENIKPDTTGMVKLDSSFVFEKPSLVVFSVNEVIPGCFTTMFTSEKFPRLTKTSELADALYYIAKPYEYRHIKTAENEKLALDSFWLNIGGTKEFSRRLIKSYYSRVEFANKYFTSFKEGWKTDKGMIFIIFGKPDAVVRFEDYEEWHYERLLNNDFYTFEFVRKPIFLSKDNFELVRKEDHSKVWFPMVDKWRNGVIIK